MTSPVFTAIGTAIGLTGWIATAAGAAIVGGGAGLVGSDISNLVQGNYPWSDPETFFKGGLMGAGIGAAGGAIGAAAGPALGAGAEAIGLSSNLGTTAAGAGAPSGGISLSGQIPKAGVDIAIGGAGGEGALAETATNVAQNLGTGAVNAQSPAWSLPSLIGEQPANIARQTLVGAGIGAAKEPDDPLRGALMGGAGSLVTSSGQMGLNAAFRGQDAGFWNPGPSKTLEYRPPMSSEIHPTQMTEFRPVTQGPGFGGQALGGGVRFAGSAARMGVGNAMTPRPAAPAPDPYAVYNRPPSMRPYWMR